MIIRNLKKIILQISLFLLILNVGLFFEIQKSKDLDQNRIIFLNVGQGDAILIHNRNYIGLIDTGPGNIISERLDRYIPIQRDILDFIVLTHFDKDHIEGFLRLADSFTIKNLFISNINKDNLLIEEIKKIAIQKNIETFYLRSINDFFFNDIEFNVVWPISDTYFNSDDSNDTSIAIELKIGDCNIYTAGDLSSKFETESIKDLPDKNTEVLKLGHHGSKTSTSLEFIIDLQPDIAIVSAGENNSYGHPHKEVIDILSKNNIPYLETKNDDIIVKLNGDNTISIQQQNSTKKINCF